MSRLRAPREERRAVGRSVPRLSSYSSPAEGLAGEEPTSDPELAVGLRKSTACASDIGSATGAYSEASIPLRMLSERPMDASSVGAEGGTRSPGSDMGQV